MDELADHWSCDGHKSLNVPYDSGFASCSRPDVHAAAVSYTASYLVGSTGAPAGSSDFTLEASRCARGPVWAALRQLGGDGVADLFERSCHLADRVIEAVQRRDGTCWVTAPPPEGGGFPWAASGVG